MQHPQIPGLKEAFKVNPLGCIQIRFTRLHLNTTGIDMMVVACQPDFSRKTFQFLNVSRCSHNTRALFIVNGYILLMYSILTRIGCKKVFKNLPKMSHFQLLAINASLHNSSPSMIFSIQINFFLISFVFQLFSGENSNVFETFETSLSDFQPLCCSLRVDHVFQLPNA